MFASILASSKGSLINLIIHSHFQNWINIWIKQGEQPQFESDNKAKGRISKRIFQENKAGQIFQKTSISYHLR